MRRIILTIGVITALAAASACGAASGKNTKTGATNSATQSTTQGATQSASAATGGTVTIGESTTLSGSIAELGQSGLDGVRFAADEINAKGGLLGKQIKVVSADDTAKPPVGSANVRNMITNDKVSALFGPVSSAVAAAEEAIAAQYKVPIFFHTSNDTNLMTKTFTKYGFQVVPNTLMEPRAVADYLAKKADGKQITVATFAPDYSFGHDSVAGFLAALDALHVNYKLVNQQFPPLGESNIAPYLSKLVAAAPQFVYNAQYGGDLVTFTKQAEGYGFFDKTTVIAMYDSPVLTALGASVPNGAIGFDRAPFWAMGQQIADFPQRFKTKYGDWPSEWAVLAYTAVQSWAYGVTKANSFDGDKVSDALSGATVPTIRGDVTFRSCDHQANVAEYVGVVSSKPDPTYNVPLWDPSSVFTAPFEQISKSC
jgi:branched-chain amino acid transport system substrate-binding protein